jgi:hypothetical protein
LNPKGIYLSLHLYSLSGYDNSQSLLTVRLLETRTGTTSTVLLGFAPTRVAHQHVSVVLNQDLSQFVLGLLIHVLGVVGNDTLGNSRANSVNLSGDTSTLDTDADIEVAELFLSNNQDGLEDLQAKGLGLDVLNGLTIDLDQATTLLGKSHCGRSLFPER